MFRVMGASQVISVNVGGIRTILYRGKDVPTGIFKNPVKGKVPLRGVNLLGDEQADRKVHGGPEQAVYAYASEDYAWWEGELSRSLPSGQFGENLTTRGIDIGTALIGERWRVGSALLQITAPRLPCFKLATKMEEPHFIKRFAAALRPGTYFAVVEEGEIGAGDPIEVALRPAHRLTVAEMARIYLFQRERLAELLVPELPASWREAVESRLAAQ
jgi:MOSC domain-containing protein YiiM